MTTLITLQLGQSVPAAQRQPVDDARGRVFYLPQLEAVLTPEYRSGDGWRCAVIARRRPEPSVRHVLLSYTEIVAAPSTVAVDAEDAEAVAMVWLAEVWQRWRGGLVHLGAHTLAEDIRTLGTLMADVDQRALGRLAEVTRLRTPGVRRLLDRLTVAGLLTPAEAQDGSGLGTYTLRLPALAVAAPDLWRTPS